MKFSSILAGALIAASSLSSTWAEDISTIYHNLSSSASKTIIQDINEDGLPDIVLSPEHHTPLETTSYLLQQEDGSFDGPHVYHLAQQNLPSSIISTYGRLHDTAEKGLIYLEFHDLQNETSDRIYTKAVCYRRDADSLSLETTYSKALNLSEIFAVEDFDGDSLIDIVGLTNDTERKLTICWGGDAPDTIFDLTYGIDFNHYVTTHSTNELKDINISYIRSHVDENIYKLTQSTARQFSPLELIHTAPAFGSKTLVDNNNKSLGDVLFTQNYEGSTFLSSLKILTDHPNFSGWERTYEEPSTREYLGFSYSSTSSFSFPVLIHLEPTQIPYDQTAQIVISYLFTTNQQVLDVPTSASPSHNSIQLVSGSDINNDGYGDIIISVVTAFSGSPYLPVLYISHGSEAGYTEFKALGSPPISEKFLCIGKFHSDYNNSILVGPDINGNCCLFNFNDKLWIRSEVTLLSAAQQTAGVRVDHINHIDLNEDGLDDLFITFALYQSNIEEPIAIYNMIALNDGNANFTLEAPLPDEFVNGLITHRGGYISDFIDCTGDGKLDAVNQRGGWHEQLDSTFDAYFHQVIDPSIIIPLGSYLLTNSKTLKDNCLFADFNNDGYIDFLIPNYFTDTIPDTENLGVELTCSYANIFFNIQNTGYYESSTLYHQNILTSGVLGVELTLPQYQVEDINKDGYLDLIIHSVNKLDVLAQLYAEYETFVIYNDSTGKFVNSELTPEALRVNFQSEPMKVDYNGDGNIDIASYNQYLTPTTEGPAISPVHLESSQLINDAIENRLYSISVAADFDGDFDADLILSRTVSPGYTASAQSRFSISNPLVDSARADVQHALALGLRAEDTQLDADPDGDGISNQLEYLFGGSMIEKDEEILPTFVIDPANKSFMGKARVRSSQLANYIVEVSSDMENWQQCNLVLPRDEQGEFTELQQNIEVESELGETPQAFIRWSVK
ncbi:hypothetical protein [Persicirhabdus sediminis]|uniref:Repeat domain-containing protein n=1 Tax=Persicirhabdus sediminis TaxID=454144 RepID=A0A8J7MII2_9BACT|nr:hypothetical protein [Persicirhabdus sediminis]MBK1791668.1 hypothetical protein [Persicirhabdus sediminis]